MDGQDGGEQHVVTVITYPDPVQLLKHALVDDTPVRRVGIGAYSMQGNLLLQTKYKVGADKRT